MKVGDIIEAQVLRVEEGFALLSHQSMNSTLMQTEVTWKVGPVDVHEYASSNSKLRVLVTDIKGDKFSVSLRQVNPNPWSNPPEKGQKFNSPIVMVTDYGYFVRINWFCDALLLNDGSIGVHKIGDEVKVEVANVDLDNKHVSVVEMKNDL